MWTRKAYFLISSCPPTGPFRIRARLGLTKMRGAGVMSAGLSAEDPREQRALWWREGFGCLVLVA